MGQDYIPVEPPSFGGSGMPMWLQVMLWVVGILVPLIGSAVAGYWVWQGRREELKTELDAKQVERETNRDTLEFAHKDKFYQTMMARLESVDKRNDELYAEVVKLRQEVAVLSEKLEYYEENPATHMARDILAAIANSKFTNAMWLHDVTSNKWYINDAYAVMFDIKRKDFWTPVNIYAMFPKDVVVEYVQNDLSVIEAKVPITYTERVRTKIMDPHCETYVDMVVCKTPLEVRGLAMICGELISKKQVSPEDVKLVEYRK